MMSSQPLRPPVSLLFLASLCSLCLCGSSSALAAGFGEADITPKMGETTVYMAGFGNNRKATKVHDPLMARAVVIRDNNTKVALVSIDVVGFGYPNVLRIRTQLPGVAYVLVSSTHNHEGPDTIGLWGPNLSESGVDPGYTQHLEAQVVKAVKGADKARKSVEARIGTAKNPDLLHDGREPFVKHDELV